MTPEAPAAPEILSQVFEYPLLVKEAHLDMFGHMNNAVYLELFEEARWDIITARGYGLDTVVKSQIGPTILGITLQFRREIRNRELITIKTWVSKVSGKTVNLHQVMINAKGEEACTADFVLGLFDMSKRKLIEPTAEWNKALGMA